MRVLSFLPLTAAAPLVSAIQFQEPFSNSTLSKGQSYSVKWSSVDTDPSTFSLYLVNFVNWPPFYTQIASDVSTGDGSLDVTIPCAVDNSWGYQFNAINGTNVYVIHAQTPKFYVGGYCVDEKPLDSIPSDSLEEEEEVVAVETCEAVTVTAVVTTVVTVSPGAPEQPATNTAAPTIKWGGGFEPVQTVYSTKYIDLSEVEDGQCAC
ncbi:Ser-Thr-rich glycosyl-phosphatidyl-inositol-anchored membrane family-domain-containing protein [Podospora fimiseda]|uniref:Ser-Thr-rich glycosyl-phosphatidyl-inositol-anchored membrane family-domain-containing protein n=1 Tax=Podospora fimiseda TaxID=252190 RepID=A0AAN7BX18_9PEZI|nr:Ser-Thr-rich glycosyl-phosphatidyl-inositol-anchored membrane family-domain-containing protein [Podospora fimiseda]